MRFVREKTLHFQHCDPAGIIFYPQYFVLFHEVLENWWTEGLGIPYGDYIRRQRLGVPAVRTATRQAMPRSESSPSQKPTNNIRKYTPGARLGRPITGL